MTHELVQFLLQQLSRMILMVLWVKDSNLDFIVTIVLDIGGSIYEGVNDSNYYFLWITVHDATEASI